MSNPSLKSLQYFCVAARHQSFKQAASELSITPGAVSQQIQILERWIGQPLFRRKIREVQLTDAGNLLYRRANPLIAELWRLTQSMQRNRGNNSVRISLPPSFALLKFSPKLVDFHNKHPNIELQINTSTLLSALDGTDNDLAIRYLPETEAQPNNELLSELNVIAVCSPNYLHRFPKLKKGIVSGCALLHDHIHQEWSRAFVEFNLQGKPKSNLFFDQSTLSRQAALDSLGVWLTDTLLAAEDLISGHLINLYPEPIRSSRGLYVAHSKDGILSPAVQATRTWIIEQFSNRNTATNGL